MGKLMALGIRRPIRPIQNGGASTLTRPAAKMRRGITMRMPASTAAQKASPRPIQTSLLVSPPPNVRGGSIAQIAPPKKTKMPATCTNETGSFSHTRAVMAAKIGLSDQNARFSVIGSHLADMKIRPKSTTAMSPYKTQKPTATNSPVTRSRGTGTSPLRLSWNKVKATRPVARMIVIWSEWKPESTRYCPAAEIPEDARPEPINARSDNRQKPDVALSLGAVFLSSSGLTVPVSDGSAPSTISLGTPSNMGPAPCGSGGGWAAEMTGVSAKPPVTWYSGGCGPWWWQRCAGLDVELPNGVAGPRLAG
mmetsp:Transcript_20179/g.62692  ORF Transcript_20179/g.62692 Transcript_20179/m.62692 type:complete len:308 (+) Transcript_20179:134-1057(+)